MEPKPNDHIMLEDGTLGVVKKILYQKSENGEAAVAIVLVLGEIIKPLTVHLKIEAGHYTLETMSMASPEQVQAIQDKLLQQREMMRVHITSSISQPHRTGGGSATGRVRQLERAKERRAEEKDMMQAAIDAYITQNPGSTKDDAMAHFAKLAGA